jgi:hypothetical protein
MLRLSILKRLGQIWLSTLDYVLNITIKGVVQAVASSAHRGAFFPLILIIVSLITIIGLCAFYLVSSALRETIVISCFILIGVISWPFLLLIVLRPPSDLSLAQGQEQRASSIKPEPIEVISGGA